MYDDQVNRIPRNVDELWDVLLEQFEYVHFILCELKIETQEDALNRHLRRHAKAGMDLIRYRNISEEIDQRDHFLELGCSLIPSVQQALEERRLTPRFIQQWGQIMFCHGYIAAHYFDDSGGDVGRIRAGLKTKEKRSRDAQRKWLAHLVIPLVDGGMTRAEAEEKAAEHISGIIEQSATQRRLSLTGSRTCLARASYARHTTKSIFR